MLQTTLSPSLGTNPLIPSNISSIITGNLELQEGEWGIWQPRSEKLTARVTPTEQRIYNSRAASRDHQIEGSKQ